MPFKRLIFLSITATPNLGAPAVALSECTKFEQRLGAYADTKMREQEVPGLAMAVPRGGEMNRCQRLWAGDGGGCQPPITTACARRSGRAIDD